VINIDLTASGIRTTFDEMVLNGTIIRFKYFNCSYSGADYDDAVVYSQSGNDVWTSGLFYPIKAKRGSYEAFLLEQGRLTYKDKVLYIRGTIDTSGTWQVGIGSPSPATEEYAMIEDGVVAYPVKNEIVYKKIFIRNLQGGSIVSPF
jgi:hypothetical protein